MVDTFNKTSTLQKVSSLAPMARVAFAAACASRLFPVYEALPGNSEAAERLKDALNSVWEAIVAKDYEVVFYERQLDAVMELTQAEADTGTIESAYREDAAAAVAYALRALITGSVEDPVWAVQRVFEALARSFMRQQGGSLKGTALVVELHKLPEMQLEFSRQKRDLDDLANWSLDTAAIIKERAQREPAAPAGSLAP